MMARQRLPLLRISPSTARFRSGHVVEFVTFARSRRLRGQDQTISFSDQASDKRLRRFARSEFRSQYWKNRFGKAK